MSRSAAFQRLEDSVARGVQSLEDLAAVDLDAVMQLADDELDDAVALLAGPLRKGAEDPRFVDALMVIATPEALDAVNDAMTQAGPVSRVRAARRLWSLDQRKTALDAMRDAMQFDSATLHEELVPALVEVDTDAARDLLMELLRTTSVRQTQVAVAGIIQSHHRLDQPQGLGSKALSLRLGLTSPSPSVQAEAVAELSQLAAKRAAGASLASLGFIADPPLPSAPAQLPPDAAAVYNAVMNGSALDADALDALADPYRGWIADVLIRRLYKDDARAPDALRVLDTARARLALADTGR